MEINKKYTSSNLIENCVSNINNNWKVINTTLFGLKSSYVSENSNAIEKKLLEITNIVNSINSKLNEIDAILKASNDDGGDIYESSTKL